MTSESEFRYIPRKIELGISYEPLTHKAFFDVVGRIRGIILFQDIYNTADYGCVELTGELIDGKPTYDFSVNESLLPKQKALTLTHEVVHIHWEEDVFNYRDKPSGVIPYNYFFPEGTDFMTMYNVKMAHEDRVEAEAKRFFRANHRLVIGTYNRMIAERRLVE